jgi:uncharacterized protein RhaS with RHS repeats
MNGSQNSVSDYYGDTNATVYSITGATLETINPKGGVTKMTLHGDDEVVATSDPNNDTSSATYDSNGNKTSRVERVSGTVLFWRKRFLTLAPRHLLHARRDEIPRACQR